jgi:4-amino-4-deoxy-L-arabinose transferase-like glycosyltransferase
MWNRIRAVLASPAFIVLVAFVFRLGLIYFKQVGAPLPRADQTPFGYETGRVAASFAAGKGFSSPLGVESGPTAWFTPIYPLLVALVLKLFGTFTYASALVCVSMNSLFSALTCWPIFLIARRLFGRGVAVGSAWLWVFLPSAAAFPIDWIWETSLAALMLALIVLATFHVTATRGPWPWFGYGLLWALGVLTSPALVSLLPFLLVWAALRGCSDSRARLKLAAVCSLGFALAMTPWVVRNYFAFGKFIPLRSNFGLELWLGNNEQVPDSWTPDLHPNDNAEERAKYVRMGEIAYMAEKQHLALQFIKTHPADFARFVYHRFMNNWTGLWDPIADILPHVSWDVGALLVGNSLFSVLAFAGILLASRARSEGTFPLACTLLVFPIIYYVTHTSLRYRHPIDPMMDLLAVYAVAHAWALRFHRRAIGPTESTEVPLAERVRGLR